MSKRVNSASQNSFKEDGDVLYFKISDNKKISKEAVKIIYNPESSEFTLENLNKNTILVDRSALKSK